MTMIQTAKEAIKRATGLSSRAASLQPRLERVDAIDARFPAIAESLQELTSPVARAEQVERLQEWIRRLRARFVAESSGPYDTAARASLVLEPLSRWKEPADPQIATADVWPVLCWLLGDALVAGAPQAVAMRPDPGGLPSAERRPLVAKLEAERAALVQERRQLVDDVNSESESGLGITLKHLPETQAVIDTEERQRQRDQEQAEHKARIEEWKRAGEHPITVHRSTMYPDRSPRDQA